MRALIVRFLDHLEGERALSPHTVRAYEGDLLRFVEFLSVDYWSTPPEAIELAAIDVVAVRSFLAALARDHGRRSQGRALSALRTFFRWACRVGEAAANPAQRVRTPKAPQLLPRHLRPGEIEALLAAPAGDEPMAQRDRAILELLYATGLAGRRAGRSRLARPRAQGARAAHPRQGGQGAHGAVRAPGAGGAARLARRLDDAARARSPPPGATPRPTSRCSSTCAASA